MIIEERIKRFQKKMMTIKKIKNISAIMDRLAKIGCEMSAKFTDTIDCEIYCALLAVTHFDFIWWWGYI